MCVHVCVEFSSGVFAILKGKVVEFMMTSHSVTLGRSSAAGQVDFDLSLEAPAFKISRRQVSRLYFNKHIFYTHRNVCDALIDIGTVLSRV